MSLDANDRSQYQRLEDGVIGGRHATEPHVDQKGCATLNGQLEDDT